MSIRYFLTIFKTLNLNAYKFYEKNICVCVCACAYVFPMFIILKTKQNKKKKNKI